MEGGGHIGRRHKMTQGDTTTHSLYGSHNTMATGEQDVKTFVTTYMALKWHFYGTSMAFIWQLYGVSTQ